MVPLTVLCCDPSARPTWAPSPSAPWGCLSLRPVCFESCLSVEAGKGGRVSSSLHRGSALLAGAVASIPSSPLDRNYRQLVQGHTPGGGRNSFCIMGGGGTFFMPSAHLSWYASPHTDQETAYLTEARANLGRSSGFPYSVGSTLQSLGAWRHLLATYWKSLLMKENFQ